MGEYADDYYRRELRDKYGFDIGSMYADANPSKSKKRCPKCGKCLKTDQGVKDHLRDYHDVTPNVQIEGLAATKRDRRPESSKNRRP